MSRARLATPRAHYDSRASAAAARTRSVIITQRSGTAPRLTALEVFARDHRHPGVAPGANRTAVAPDAPEPQE